MCHNRCLSIVRWLFLIFLLLGGAHPAGPARAAQETPSLLQAPPAPEVAAVVEEYRQVIREQMAAQHIPGFAIALVDDDEVLWAEGFGCADWSCRTPVTTDTFFSIQSMTKSFTAVAVLLAVQEGLLDLDVPISTYLPDFTVHSLFDERPQDLITLRMLLSHTAGFTHEAPVGNNFDLDPGTWATHVASISETWLKFPVGQHYAYSNLGIDLAGYIVQVAAGVPFHAYVQTLLLDPLGMANSTLDRDAISALPHRALGHAAIFPDLPLVTIMPSGGCYASVADMARYLQFHINRGTFEGQEILQRPLADALTTPHFRASASQGYGLGLGFGQGSYGALRVGHGGGGFGFLSMMTWYPDLKLGVVWLSNGTGHDLQDWLANAILDSVINASPVVYLARDAEFPYDAPVPPAGPAALSPSQITARIQALALAPDAAAATRRAAYAGTYGIRTWGRMAEVVTATAGEQFVFRDEPMVEVEPGLFVSPDGETLDFRGAVPFWRSIELEKLDGALSALRIALGACGVVLISALPWGITSVVAGVRRRRQDPRPPRSSLAWVRGAWGAVVILASLLALASFAVVLNYQFLLFGGMPLPYRVLPTEQRVMLIVPYTVAGLTLLAASGVALAWARELGPRWSRVWATLIAVALVVFCVLVVL